MNASRKTPYGSDKSYQHCGEYGCGQELQSRVDLGSIHNDIYEVRRLIDLSGSRWQQDAQHEWHPKNPQHEVLHLPNQMVGQVTGLLDRSGFDPLWEGTGDGYALVE